MKKNKSSFRKIRSKLILLLWAVVFVMAALYAFRYTIYDYLLDRNAVQTVAKIIDKKNILSHSAVDPEFTYSYQFYFDGTGYTGDSKNEVYGIGDAITVEYWRLWPQVNRPKINK